jgi:hypothetical protein
VCMRVATEACWGGSVRVEATVAMVIEEACARVGGDASMCMCGTHVEQLCEQQGGAPSSDPINYISLFKKNYCSNMTQ